MKNIIQLLKGLVALGIGAIVFAIVACVIYYFPGVLFTLYIIFIAYLIGGIFME